MNRLLLAIAFSSTPAWAWTPGELGSVPVPGAPEALEVVLVDGAPALLGTGPDGSFLVRPDGEVLSTSPQTGLDLAMVGTRDAFVCDEYGLYHLPIDAGRLGAPHKVTSERCAAVASFTKTNGSKTEDWLISATDLLGLWKVTPSRGLTGPNRFGLRLGGEPLVVARGDRFAATGTGDSEIVERSDFGRSSLMASGKVGGLAIADGVLSWVLTDVDAVEDASRRVVEVATRPTGLAAADVDGDGREDLIVPHAGKVGIIYAGAAVEQTFVVPARPIDVVAHDLDGDGCSDLVLVQELVPVLAIVPGVCGEPVDTELSADPPVAQAPPPKLVGGLGGGPSVRSFDPEPEPEVPQPVEPPPVRPPDPLPDTIRIHKQVWPTIEVGVGEQLSARLQTPTSEPARLAGAPPALQLGDADTVSYVGQASDIGRHDIEVVLADNPDTVLGGFFLDVVEDRASPASLIGVLERDQPPRRAVVLGDTEPEVMAMVGVPSHLRLELDDGQPEQFMALGLPPNAILLPNGTIDWTPTSDDLGSWRVNVRMWGGTERVRTESFRLEVVNNPNPSAEMPASARYPNVLDDFGYGPRGPRRSPFNSNGPGSKRPDPPSDGTFRSSPWAVRACSLSGGVTAGISATNNDWAFVGQDALISVSATVAGLCSGGGTRTRWFIGWDSSPSFFYLGPVDPAHDHVIGMTVGGDYGSETFRAGGYLTAGATLLGFGARFVALPLRSVGGGRHGLELRTTLFVPSAPAASATLMYTYQFKSFKK